MKPSQISYIRQKLMNLSKEDLINFARFNNTWIRPYWPKSEIADAIISGEKENVNIRLKQWAKQSGKEKTIFTPESREFWKPPDKRDQVDDGKKTFSEEFLERWKKLSSKEEEAPKIEIKMPPRIAPGRPEMPERRPPMRRPGMIEPDRFRERIKEPGLGKPPERPKPPFKPPEKYPLRTPAGLRPPKKELVEPEPSRYSPFRTQFEDLKKKITDKVSELRDPEKLLKEELVKETEELDRFMQKELEMEGISFDSKETDMLRTEPLTEKEKKDFDQHLKEIEEKLSVRELAAPSKLRVKAPLADEMALKMPSLEKMRIVPPKMKFDVHTGKVIERDTEKDKEMELRAKFFEKYIKRTMAEEEEEEEEAEEEEEREAERPKLTPPPKPIKRRPPSPEVRKEILAGRVNGRGLINGVIYRKGLVNGYGYSNGLVNGRVNGRGLINGMVLERTSEEDDIKRKIRRIGLIRSRFRRRVIVTSIMIFFLMVIPVIVLMIPVPDGGGITIDGQFDDWKEAKVVSYEDSLSDQTSNENINLIEVKLSEKKDTVSFYMKVNGELMAGQPVDDGFGKDVARVFIDYDSDNETGYIINNIGADHMFQITGYNKRIERAQVFGYYPSENNQYDWNGWKFSSVMRCAVIGQEMEGQYWFSDAVNITDQFKAYFVLQDSSGRLDTGDAVITNTQKGALSIEQYRVRTSSSQEIDILESGWVDVITLEVSAYGEPITISTINFNARYYEELSDEAILLDLIPGETILGLPLNEEIIPGDPKTYTIQINTRDLPQGSMFEIGLTNSEQVESSADVISIGGLPPKYYIQNATGKIKIDGAFGDWNSVEAINDSDAETLTNENINLSSYRFTQDNSSIYFQFEVYGTMLGGTIMPVGSSYFYPYEEQFDTDGDGVPDLIDPNPTQAIDSDRDTLFDDYEVVIMKTNPNDPDSDGDLLNDNIDPAPLDPNIPPLPPELPPELQVGKDTSIILIDTDQNVNTGYRLTYADIGAEYMVEVTGKYQMIFESKLQSFDGLYQYDWKWAPVNDVNVAIDEHRMESAINLSDIKIHPGDGFNLFYLIFDWTEHRDDAKDVFGYEPPGTLRVGGDIISPGAQVRNRDTVGILRLTLYSNEQHVRVYSINTNLIGSYDPSDVERVILFNDDDFDGILTNVDTELSDVTIDRPLNSSVELKLLDFIELKPGVDRTVFIAIETGTSVNTGKTVGLEINSMGDISTNVRSVIGDFPIASNLFFLQETSSRAPPHSVVYLDLNTTYTGPSSATQGDAGVKIMEFTMTATNGDATISSITLTHTGNGPASDITNVYLEGPNWNLSGSFGTFSFPPFVINDTQTLTFKVYFDISMTASVGKFHGVKVAGVGVDSNTKVRGNAKSNEQMTILAIPEIPDQYMPVLIAIVVTLISFKTFRKRNQVNNKT